MVCGTHALKIGTARLLFRITRLSTILQLWNLYSLIFVKLLSLKSSKILINYLIKQQATNMTLFWKLFTIITIYLLKQTINFIFMHSNHNFLQSADPKQSLIMFLYFLLFFEEELIYYTINKNNEISRKQKLILVYIASNIPLFLIQMVLIFHSPDHQTYLTLMYNSVSLFLFTITILESEQINLSQFFIYDLFKDYELKKESIKVFTQSWLKVMLHFYCLIQCFKLQYFIIIYIVINLTILVVLMNLYQQYRKQLIYNLMHDLEFIVIITPPVLFCVHLDLRFLGAEYYKAKQFLPIKLLDVFMVSQLIQKQLVYIPIFIMFTLSRNNLEFQDMVYILFIFIIADIAIQIKNIYQFVIHKLIHGSEYIEITSLSETKYLIKNEYQYQNLKVIKFSKSQNVNLQLILFSFQSCSVIGVSIVGDFRIQSKTNPLRQDVFINKQDQICVNELKEQLQQNFINPYVEKIIFSCEKTTSEIVKIASLLLQYENYKIIDFKKESSKIEHDEFLQIQLKSYINPMQNIFLSRLAFNHQIEKLLDNNPNQVFYDLYE